MRTLLCLTLALLSAPALAAEPIGSVKIVHGQAQVVRNGAAAPLAPGALLQAGDTLLTGQDATVGALFRDDSSLSVGPDSRITLDEFVFDPAGGSLKMLSSLGKGTACFITGQIAKLSPESITVRTPLSTIGVRGTRFLIKVE